jgi:hypothetical protein
MQNVSINSLNNLPFIQIFSHQKIFFSRTYPTKEVAEAKGKYLMNEMHNGSAFLFDHL